MSSSSTNPGQPAAQASATTPATTAAPAAQSSAVARAAQSSAVATAQQPSALTPAATPAQTTIAAQLAASNSSCTGSLLIKFLGDDVRGIQVDVTAGTGFVESRKLYSQEHEVRFANVPQDATVTLGIPSDLAVSTAQIKSGDPTNPASSSAQIYPGTAFTVTITAPYPTEVNIPVDYAPRTVNVMVFSDAGRSGDQDGIGSVAVQLWYENQIRECQQTAAEGTIGSASFTLSKPGLYRIEAPSSVAVTDANNNQFTYNLVRSGPILVTFQRGQTSTMTVPIRYSNKLGGVLTVAPVIEDATVNGSPAIPVQFALFSDRDTNFFQTGSSSGTPPVIWDGVPDGLYTLVVKCPNTLDLVWPRDGSCRLALDSGRTDFTRYVKVRPAPATTNATQLSGQISDDNGPVANRIIELLIAATQQIVFTSFTDPNGNYSFQTTHDLTKLALRVEGYVVPVLSTQPAVAGPIANSSTNAAAPVTSLAAEPVWQMPAPPRSRGKARAF
jgi:hypothetical protein